MIEKIEEVTFQTRVGYKCSDGLVVNNESEANIHEEMIELDKNIQLLPYVDGAYYCETENDYNTIIEYYACMNNYFSFEKGIYIKGYNYKSKFKGSDWYFFNYEYNDNYADEYWIETLSEKKEEWDNFYKQFKIGEN